MGETYHPDDPNAALRPYHAIFEFALRTVKFRKNPTESVLQWLSDATREDAATEALEEAGRSLAKAQADGKLPTDGSTASACRTAFAELLDDLNKSIPDARRLEILRRAVVATAIGLDDDPDGTRALLFVRAARSLEGDEAIVLGAAFRIRLPEGGARPGEQWDAFAMKETRIAYIEELRRIRGQLLQKGLVVGAGAWNGRHKSILSEFGVGLCEFLEKAEPITPPGEAAE